MWSYFECGTKTVLVESRRPRVPLQNALNGMHQGIDDLLTREVLVRTGQHDLVQECSKEHFEATENVCIQRLQKTRHPRRYEHWPDIKITARSKCAGGEMTFMCVQQ